MGEDLSRRQARGELILKYLLVEQWRVITNLWSKFDDDLVISLILGIDE